MILGPSAFQLRSKIVKKAFPDRSKMKENLGQYLDWFFDRFWSQLGLILGRFWRPSWSQVGTKWHQNLIPQPIKKMITFWSASDQFFLNFWSQLGSPGGSTSVGFDGFSALGAFLAPRWAQEPPRSPKRCPRQVPKTDLGAILVDFWLIFWLFFGWFGDSSRLFLLVVVLVCCLVGLLVCWFLGLLAGCLAGCLVCWLFS